MGMAMNGKDGLSEVVGANAEKVGDLATKILTVIADDEDTNETVAVGAVAIALGFAMQCKAKAAIDPGEDLTDLPDKTIASLGDVIRMVCTSTYLANKSVVANTLLSRGMKMEDVIPFLGIKGEKGEQDGERDIT
jgi:hypothetical protein